MLKTHREAPGDAEAISHQLLVRGGYIRRLASGVYGFMPLGLRMLQKVESVVRSEMDGAGAQELLLPVLHPRELWQQSGRDELMDPILMRVEAKGGAFVLGPTHEEVVTSFVAATAESYRDLPLNVYQIQTKFRDEERPRFGLMRTREFLMKDAYSFDRDADAMAASYRNMFDAYCRIFDRLELDYTPVEADSGAIGGDVNNEFMVPSDIGEDFFARCSACGWAANIETAVAGTGPEVGGEATPDAGVELERHHTPGATTIEAAVEVMGIESAQMLKCFTLKGPDGQLVMALVPGDREVLVAKLGADLEALDGADFAARPELAKGFISPMRAQEFGFEVVADPSIRASGNWATGADEHDWHVTGCTLDRDFSVDRWASIASIAEGDPCPTCGESQMELVRSVEAGHTFQLGLTYSNKIPGASFLSESGEQQPYWMGCYGIGVTRLAAVVAEEHHDENGLMWPDEVAPFQIHLLSLGAGRAPEVANAADALHDDLVAAGFDVLYDDRDVSPGVKFNDADLLGMPVQLALGRKGLEAGIVERKHRRTGERDEIPLDGVTAALSA